VIDKPPEDAMPAVPARRRKPLWIGLSAAAGLALVVVAALVLSSKPSSAVQRMVPENADVYAFMYLDPPLGQKVNLLGLAHKFPDLANDQAIKKRIDDALSAALKGEGISLERDLEPWLGKEMAFFAQIADKPPAAFLIDSKDDAKAKALLAKLRKGQEGRKLSWTDKTYQGVTLAVGTRPDSESPMPFVYAYTDRTMILSNSVDYVHDVIDAGKGRKGRALDTPNYKATMGRMPSERLGFVYVNGKPVVDRIRKEARKLGPRLQFLGGGLGQLDAFTGLGFAVSAKPNGLVGDLEIKLDASKLDPATRSALSAPARSNGVTPWIPGRAYALFTTTGLKQTLQSSLDSATPEARQELDALGLRGLVARLTGEAGFELDAGVGAAVRPGLSLEGALLLGTDDPAGMSAFLDSYVLRLTQSLGLGGGNKITSTYKGVTLTSVNVPQLSFAGANLTFAVTGGMVLIGSSDEEIKAMIDAHETGQSIAQDSQFATMVKEVDATPNTLLYVDIAEVVRQVQGRAPAEVRLDQREALRNAAPFRAVILSAKSTPDQVSDKTFLRIE
jgi:hypothetical protein